MHQRGQTARADPPNTYMTTDGFLIRPPSLFPVNNTGFYGGGRYASKVTSTQTLMCKLKEKPDLMACAVGRGGASLGPLNLTDLFSDDLYSAVAQRVDKWLKMMKIACCGFCEC